MTFITFGICTYNRSSLLDILLHSILLQIEPDCEVIINNDGNDPETTHVLDKYSRLIENIKIYQGNEGGLSLGRQRILENATGELVAFIDDDAILSPFWLHSLRSIHYENKDKYSVYGGPAFPAFSSYTTKRIPTNCLAKLSILTECTNGAETGRYPVGANFVTKRAELKTFHFSSELGRTKNSLSSNEETSYFRYLGNSKIGYFNSLSVVHCVDTRRLEKKWLRNRYQAEGNSYAKMLIMQGNNFDIFKYFSKLLLACLLSGNQLRPLRVSQLIGAYNAIIRK